MASVIVWRNPMIRQLRKRLTLLYTLTTGAILTAVVIGLLFYQAQSVKKDQNQRLQNQFQNQIVLISSQMHYGSTLSGSWLAETEVSGKLIVHIEENGNPLLYAGSWSPATDRQILVERAKEHALEESVSTTVSPVSASLIQSSVFELEGDHGDSYYGSVLVFPTTKGFQSLTLLGSRMPENVVLKRQAPLFLFLDLLGIAALGLVSWFFVGKSLQPVEQSRKRQNEFIAAASHELRSPLAVIEASTSAIDAEPDKRDQYLKNIREECRRMASLVSDMLLLASTDAESWSLKRQNVDMDTLLIDVYELFEPVCREKQISLNLELPETPLPHVYGDISRLKQIFTILLDNAAAYTPKGKSITIRAAAGINELTILVSDQGCGIPDKQKAYIFDRFYRGDAARTDKKHFGLGLSIAMELTHLHGGDIFVKDAEGGGAVFCVKLREI